MFDFQKAINGEPIYLDGKFINVSYNPQSKLWRINMDEWNKNGLAMLGNYRGDLSTDHPKKKVMVTAYVYKHFGGTIEVSISKILDFTPDFKLLGEISGEVEI
jgi:hypothetical protein